jgi:hypothetical protein
LATHEEEYYSGTALAAATEHAGCARTQFNTNIAGDFMNRLFALALLLPVMALAKSPFDGTWMQKVDSIKVTGKPDVFDLSNGMYNCSSCVPAYKIKADGTDQPVPGHDYLDHEAVKVVNATTVEFTDKKAGKVMETYTDSVSADGATLTGKFTFNGGEKPISGGFTEKRAAAGPAGSHAISGTWQPGPMSDLSDAARTSMMQSTDNGMKITWNGQTLDAKFDGKDYAWTNEPGHTMSSLKKVSDNQIEETDHRGGKVTDISTYTVSADGKWITAIDDDQIHGTKTTSMMQKQM